MLLYCDAGDPTVYGLEFSEEPEIDAVAVLSSYVLFFDVFDFILVGSHCSLCLPYIAITLPLQFPVYYTVLGRSL